MDEAAKVERVAVRGMDISSTGSRSDVGRLKSDMEGPCRLNNDRRVVEKRWREGTVGGVVSRSW